MPFILTPIATDNFQRADEDPLNPVNWTAWTAQASLEIISNLVSSDGGAQVRGGELYTTIVPPNNQYVSVTIGGFDGTSTLNQMSIRLRVSNDLSTYWNCVLTGQGDGTVHLTIVDEPNENQPISNFLPPLNPGDVVTFGVVGTHLFVLVNGNQVLSQVDTQGINAGNVAIFASYNAAFTDCTFSNFEVGGAAEQALTFSPLATDNFTRPDENPLNPANWSTISGLASLAVVSDVAVAGGAAVTDGQEIYTGVVTPNDQYARITIGAVGATINDNFSLELRNATDNSSGMIFASDNAGDGTMTFSIVDETESEAVQCFINVPNPGDVFTVGVIGSTFFIQLNGVQFLSLNDTLGIASGFTGMDLEYGTDPSDTNVTRFEMGQLTVPTPPSGPRSSQTRMDTGQTGMRGGYTGAHIGSIKFGPRMRVSSLSSGAQEMNFIVQEDDSMILVEIGSGSIIQE